MDHMTKKSRLLLVSLLVIILVASACSNPTSVPTNVSQPTAEQNAGYPAPQTTSTENISYPAPTSSVSNIQNPTETPDPKMGSVQGTLLRTNTPVANITLLLAATMKDENGNDIVAGLEIATAPSATTGEKGSFTFVNVPPGRYALILDVVTNQYLLSYPGKEDAIIMQVEPGKVIKLGDLDYDELPMP